MIGHKLLRGKFIYAIAECAEPKVVLIIGERMTHILIFQKYFTVSVALRAIDHPRSAAGIDEGYFNAFVRSDNMLHQRWSYRIFYKFYSAVGKYFRYVIPFRRFYMSPLFHPAFNNYKNAIVGSTNQAFAIRIRSQANN